MSVHGFELYIFEGEATCIHMHSAFQGRTYPRKPGQVNGKVT